MLFCITIEGDWLASAASRYSNEGAGASILAHRTGCPRANLNYILTSCRFLWKGFSTLMTKQRKTFCRICEAHCGLTIERDTAGRLAKIRADSEHPISAGFVCAKGLRFLDVADHPARLHTPQFRQPDGTYVAATWERAYTVIGERLRTIIAEHGVQSVGVYFGTPMIHHSLLLLTLFQWLRALGTRNLYTAASQDNANKLAAQKLIHGHEWMMPIMDIEHADFALLLGTNPLVSQGTFVHTPGGTKAYDAFRKRGGEMVIVDPRRSESAARWGGHIPIKPGTDVFLLLALLHDLRELHTAHDPPGMSNLLALAAAYPAERAAVLTGIAANQIHALSHKLRHAERATILNGVGVNQGPFGMLSVILIQAIAYLAGHFDRQGGILFQSWANVLQPLVGLTSQPSRIGGYHSHAGGLPGGILADEILTEGDEQIRALLVIGGNPLTSVPDETRLREAFEALDLLVCIDIFQNQTGALADVLLPGLTWLERFDIGGWDAMYETAPMLQTAARMRQPIGNTRNEARIIAELSLACGKPIFGNRLLAQAWARIDWDALLPRLLQPMQWAFRRRLRGAQGIPWKRAAPGVYRGRRAQRLRFWSSELDPETTRLAAFAETMQQSRHEHEFILLGRRRRLAQNSWIHNAGRAEKASEACAWLCPDDMNRCGFANGARITITSEVGQIVIPVMAQDGVLSGTIVVPHGLPEVNVNRLISSAQHFIEPASGMHQMTGHRVTITRANGG